MELPVVNHPDYVAKINEDNKFPIQKFGALADHLIKESVVKDKPGVRLSCPALSSLTTFENSKTAVTTTLRMD